MKRSFSVVIVVVAIVAVTVVAFLLLTGRVSLSGNCTTVAVTGGSHVACSGTVDTLNGKQTLSFGLGNLVIGSSVSAKIVLSVGSGTVDVSYQDVEGKTVMLQLTSKKPITIEDEVQVGTGNQVQVLIDSFHGAKVIQYTAEFTE